MATFKTIIKVIRLLLAAWEYAADLIDKKQYDAKIDVIKGSVTKMESDDEDLQQEGAHELENSFGGPASN